MKAVLDLALGFVSVRGQQLMSNLRPTDQLMTVLIHLLQLISAGLLCHHQLSDHLLIIALR